jgi:hypothetical protein
MVKVSILCLLLCHRPRILVPVVVADLDDLVPVPHQQDYQGPQREVNSA